MHADGLDAASPTALVALCTAAWKLPRAAPLLHPPPTCKAVHCALTDALELLDCSQPLAVDIGCGFGSFARSLALQVEDVTSAAIVHVPQWNVLGVDVQSPAIASARARCIRDGLTHRYGTACPLAMSLPCVCKVVTHIPTIRDRHCTQQARTFTNIIAFVVSKRIFQGSVMDCRLAFTELEAATVLAWLLDNYQGDVMLLHFGFPTPFSTRVEQAAARADGDVSVGAGAAAGGRNAPAAARSDTLAGIQRKPDFMVQVHPRPPIAMRALRIFDMQSALDVLFRSERLAGVPLFHVSAGAPTPATACSILSRHGLPF